MAIQKSYDSQSVVGRTQFVSCIIPNKMAVAMALFWVSLVLSVIGSNAAGEFSILHSPDSLKFSGSGKTLESLLKEIFSAALGLSVEENSEWKGMYVMDPFNTPEAVVEVYIDGVSTLGEHSGLKSKTYPLIVNEFEPDTYLAVEHRIKQRFTSGGNKLVNIKLSNRYELESDVFGEVTYSKPTKQNLKHLKPSVDEDNNFLDELETLQAVIKRVQNGAIIPDNIIDFINLRFRTLHPLCDFHGPNSLQAKEAKKLLADALQELNKAFVKAYDGSVLVTVVTTDVAHTRRHVRSAGADGKSISEGPVYEWNVKEFKADNSTDDSYSADYPAIFNIILWFVVVMVFSLIAIIYALIDMDPGRDSIIYRMTSTRMKKDN